MCDLMDSMPQDTHNCQKLYGKNAFYTTKCPVDNKKLGMRGLPQCALRTTPAPGAPDCRTLGQWSGQYLPGDSDGMCYSCMLNPDPN